MKNPVPINIDKFAYFGFYSGKSGNDKKLNNVYGSTTSGNPINNLYRLDTNITKEDIKEGVLIKYIDCPGYSFKELTRSSSNYAARINNVLAKGSQNTNGANTPLLTDAENPSGTPPTGEEGAENPRPPQGPSGLLLGGSKRRVTVKK